MKKLFIFPLFFALGINSQSIGDCQYRFNQYLNFHASLNRQVKFEANRILFLNASGKADLAIYDVELVALSDFMQNSDLQTQDAFFKKKGLSKLKVGQLDSIQKIHKKNSPTFDFKAEKPLFGMRIAVDPGHSAVTLAEAKLEQKYLYFPKSNNPTDSVKLFESALTFNTASLLKKMLEDKGATVFMSRDAMDHTSFNCSLSEWISKYKKPTLDSLLKIGQINSAKYQSLMKSTNYNLFWNFFRDYDLGHRAAVINHFHPDYTIIIHYNVDEKNVPWDKHTQKNFTMSFIGGAFTADNLSKTEGKMSFIRMLITPQLNTSQKLSAETVNQFAAQLKIPIAKSSDADYLKNNCLNTSSSGVYCRNLALCRKINSPLVYGESLYQDNVVECESLMEASTDLYGIKTNDRIHTVAKCYYEGLMNFLAQH